MNITGSYRIDRRNFLKSSCAGLALLPAADIYPRPRAQDEPARIALVKTSDRKKGVNQVMKLLDLTGMNGKRVVVKPNFNSADETPASTHNDTLSQLVTEIYERGARDITLGESSGPRSTQKVMEKKGIFDMARDLRFTVVNYEEIPEKDWVYYPPAGTHWSGGFHIPRLAAESEYFVSTPCLKTHGSGGVFTLSLKLSVGLTPKPIRRPMHRSDDMRRMIAELNLAYKPQLIVLDGVKAFVDGGPSRGELKTADVFVAGTDRIAVDAVGLAILKELGANRAIMERKIFEQEQIKRAVALGIGVSSPDHITFVTPDETSRQYAEKLDSILAQG